ncbi:MAG: hypothetical protein ACI4GW_11200 [Lachnospiraceae bacterium]
MFEYMRRVCGFAFFWFGLGMIVDYLLEGCLNFFVVVGSLVIAYLLFCKC